MAQATLSDALRLSVRPRLALGALLGSDSDLGLSGYLRAALRMRLNGRSARYGRGSERCRMLDGARAYMCRCGSAGTEMYPGARPMMEWCSQIVHAGSYYAHPPSVGLGRKPWGFWFVSVRAWGSSLVCLK